MPHSPIRNEPVYWTWLAQTTARNTLKGLQGCSGNPPLPSYRAAKPRGRHAKGYPPQPSSIPSQLNVRNKPVNALWRSGAVIGEPLAKQRSARSVTGSAAATRTERNPVGVGKALDNSPSRPGRSTRPYIAPSTLVPPYLLRLLPFSSSPTFFPMAVGAGCNTSFLRTSRKGMQASPSKL